MITKSEALEKVSAVKTAEELAETVQELIDLGLVEADYDEEGTCRLSLTETGMRWADLT